MTASTRAKRSALPNSKPRWRRESGRLFGAFCTRLPAPLYQWIDLSVAAIERISVLAEFERAGVQYEYVSDDEIKCKCPFHDDTSPSCAVNVEKRMFRCPVCKTKGDIITFLAGLLKVQRSTVIVDLGKRYDLGVDKTINPELVERYHARIWDAKPLVKELHDRAITDALIRQYRLGECDGRITIPVQNEIGLFVNMRRYLPGAPGNKKMHNTKGYGKVRLFPIDQLKYDTILLVGGEVKAIAAIPHLNPHGIGVITATAGEGNWDPAFTQQLKGKTVYVCMDIDEAGASASRTLCIALYRTVGWLGEVKLPLNIDQFPHGDVNDFLVGRGSLKRLLNSTEKWEPSSIALDISDEEPKECDLNYATSARAATKRIKVKAIVSAVDIAPYIIPKQVTVTCSKDQKECALCRVFCNMEDNLELHPESPAILEMVASNRSTQREALMRGLLIPPSCKVCDFKVNEYYNVEDARISPRLEITERSVEKTMQPAVCIGTGVELNEGYDLIGRTYPHPKTQQSTLLISSYSTTQDALSSYQCRDMEALEAFRPSAWTVDAIQAKLDCIYGDLEANVTRIFQRRNLHLLIDLTYHSPLFINFDGRVHKGWMETLCLGDSAQGKSETAINLKKHYGLGEKIECKNASVAGLLGGLQQLGSRWFVTWGVIPTHDKRLVILEELKGASVEVISRLTDMRSSGIAEIPKIEKRKTHARTRLVALSNPRSDLPLASYNFGIEAVRELVGGLEDIRRFDFILLVSAADLDAGVLNRLQQNRPTVEHRYTSTLCRSLVLFAWTRTAEQVAFETDAAEAVLQGATALCEEFTDAIPIVDRGSTRYKVARIAAALAARTFSTDGEVIVVRKAHVDWVIKFIRETYMSPAFGYADYTKAIRMTQRLVDEDVLRKHINEMPFPKDFIEHVLHRNKIDLQDIQDWCAWDRIAAGQSLSLMVRKHALVRDGRSYRKTPPFITFLKDMLATNNFTDRPAFIQEEF